MKLKYRQPCNVLTVYTGCFCPAKTTFMIMINLVGLTEKIPKDKTNAFLSERKDQFLALCVYQLMKAVGRGWGNLCVTVELVYSMRTTINRGSTYIREK